MDKKHKEYIKTKLKLFPFVEWDRYSTNNRDVKIFGWIKRKDNNKDFILIEINMILKVIYSFSTSSAKYSKIIADILECNHGDCHKISEILNN